MEEDILYEFRNALKERIKDSDFSYMYRVFFSEPFISDEELKKTLLQYQQLYKENPEGGWFASFHKMLRQVDFYNGQYYKEINTLTDEEMKRRRVIISILRENRTDSEKEELKDLNARMYKKEPVPINGYMGGLLHSLIYLDYKNQLMKAMEITFKICS